MIIINNLFSYGFKKLAKNFSQKFLPKFLTSKLFTKYLAELRNTADNDLDLPTANSRRWKSKCYEKFYNNLCSLTGISAKNKKI